MDINIRDYFKISDSASKIRGFLIGYTDDGKIVIKKENMIVKSGRKNILKCLTGANGMILNNDNLKIKLGNDEDLTPTTPDMVGLIKYDESLSVSEQSVKVNGIEDNNDPSIEIQFKVNGNGKISELGTFLGEEMFSRVVFDSYSVSSDMKLKFVYYIYF